MAGGEESLKNNRGFYSTVFITVLIMFGFGFVPPFGEITPFGMRILGVFIACIFAWSQGELLWPSIMGLIALALLDSGTVGSNYAAAFGNQTSGLVIASLVFCFAIQRCGLLTEISIWILSKKFAQKSPWALAIAFFLTAAFAGMLSTNCLPTTIILWALFYETAKPIGLKPYGPFTSIILVGIVVIGYSGSCIMPYNIFALISNGVAKTFDPTFQMDNFLYVVVQLLLNLIFIPLVILFLRYVVRPEINIEMVEREPYQLKLTKQMKVVTAYLIFLALAMLVPNILPEGNFIRVIFVNKLGNLGILLGLPVLMMMTRVKGEGILDIGEGLSKGVPWGLVLLVSSALAISDAMVAQSTGIVPTIVNTLAPLLEGKPPTVLIIIFCIMGLVTTNFINDIVTITILLPIGCRFVVEAGGDPILMTALFVPACIQGCFMPSGSVLGAMMHGNRTWLKSKDVYKYVFLMEMVLGISFVIATPLLVKLFG